MQQQNSKVHIHAKIALAIKAAKKRMFKRHREGMSLDDALQLFHAELPTAGVTPEKTANDFESRLAFGEIGELNPEEDEKKPNAYLQEAIDLGVDDPDLDGFAYYFGRRFEYDTEPMIVLVGLLNRLAACSKSEHHQVVDVVSNLTDRLYVKCMDGQDAAEAFRNAASANTQKILAEVHA